MTAEVSHGRGGAGNINPDDTQYVDGEVVREGVIGSHNDGAYSAGRGGAGNIADRGQPATERKDRDVIPEAAIRRHSTDTSDYHTGRGGAGNEHHHDDDDDDDDKHKDKGGHGDGGGTQQGAKDSAAAAPGAAPVGLADKLKQKLFGAFNK
ncbi:hypothetical protein MY11210_007675 [Beauveria gryllotalpidicola]